MLKKVVMLVGILAAQPAFGEKVVVDKDRLITILGIVDRSVTTAAQRMLVLSVPDAEEKKPIWVLVNSPGGSVNSGMLFIDSMTTAKSRGYTINCVSGKLAASMGFHILINCDSVAVLPNTLLLFHAPFIPSAGKVDAPVSRRLARELSYLENRFIDDLLKATGMPKGKMLYHFRGETFWTGERLAKEMKMIKVASNVEGIDEFLYSRGSTPQIHFFRSPRRFNEILYIHPSIIETFYK